MKKFILKSAICLTACAVFASPFSAKASTMTAQQLPGDYNNSCKVVGTKYYDNVTYSNYEVKVVNAIATGAVGGIGYAITKSALTAFVMGGLRESIPKVPKQKAVYTKVQSRECKDSTGVYRQLITTYYSDSKRTKELGTQYKTVR
ncbi:hypothetical protein COL23_11460 [Priestia aryabhattai]|uniref:hypothetical protein n=1 Tax=Priestia aryabhattai TaxID=412384 RepID=UPI000BF864A3|nr:hypothetical protein [Priestia aryabhattai]PFW76579.1 hypothetical protein COL23_11460 [Priestia aryabhattai]